MDAYRMREPRHVCLEGCCPTPLLGLPEPRASVSKFKNTSAVCRRDFAVTTTSSIFPNSHFTNHECLPSLQESFTQFTSAYPQYLDSDGVDRIRAQEYYHLANCNYTCLDYIGIGLFSYSQLHNQNSSRPEIGSSSSPLEQLSSNIHQSDFPFFGVSYKTGSLKTQLLHGGQESALESSMKKRIMSFLNISENDYSMVFTANRTSAFKLLAESYPFRSSKKLLTVYDYESEAVEAMINSAEKRGVKSMSAEFSWPRLRIQAAKLKKMLVSNKKKKEKRGLFVFPVHSRVTGARYPYLWMNMAQENGWHVLLDACQLGPKDMDSFGLSIISADFIICSLYKVFGENPSGFGCLFVKKSTVPILETSTSLGIVSLLPGNKFLQLPGESSGTDTELERASQTSNSFSGPIPTQTDSARTEPSEVNIQQEGSETSATMLAGKTDNPAQQDTAKSSSNGIEEIKCEGLDHVDSLGMIMISNRARCLINWLVNALLKLEHPNTEGVRLVRIYGPKVKFDRGPALAFNIYDWKGEKVEPVLVQKLADRSNISLSYAFLHHIWFSDKYNEEKVRILEKRVSAAKGIVSGNRKERTDQGIMAVTLALSFLSNFEDIYKLWAFVAQFLDADFVEKERWRYTALNQKTVEV